MKRTLIAAALLLLLTLVAFSASAGTIPDTAQEPTYGYTYEPPVYSTPESAGGGAPSDGRLNYVADEYYTVYCAFDALEVWRGVPSGLLLATFSLTDLLALGTGGTRASGGVTVTRIDANSFMASGSNGNTAPNSGSKVFSLSDCLAANGGAPAAPPPPQGDPDPLAGAPANCQLDDMQPECFDGTLQWCSRYVEAHPGQPLTRECSNAILNNSISTTQSCCGLFFAIVLAGGGLGIWRKRLRRMKELIGL